MSVPCKYHCRACGRHFYSLGAFDAHFLRHAPNGPAVACLSPGEDDEVANLYIGFEGECDIAGATVEQGVVWELEQRRRKVKARQKAATS